MDSRNTEVKDCFIQLARIIIEETEVDEIE